MEQWLKARGWKASDKGWIHPNEKQIRAASRRPFVRYWTLKQAFEEEKRRYISKKP